MEGLRLLCILKGDPMHYGHEADTVSEVGATYV